MKSADRMLVWTSEAQCVTRLLEYARDASKEPQDRVRALEAVNHHLQAIQAGMYYELGGVKKEILAEVQENRRTA